MRHLLILSLAAAALGGCAQHLPRPYVAGDGGWSLNTVEGEGLKLAYGAPDSDDVQVMLTCQPRSGEVLVSAPAVTANTLPALALSAGGRERRYAADLTAGLGEAPVLEAAIDAGDPVLKRFARSAALTVDVDGRRSILPADGGRARAFLDGCRAASLGVT